MQEGTLVRGGQGRSPESVGFSAAVAFVCLAGFVLILVVMGVVEWLS